MKPLPPGTVLAACLDPSLARWYQLHHCAANRCSHNVLADIIAGKAARTKDIASISAVRTTSLKCGCTCNLALTSIRWSIMISGGHSS